MKTLRYLIDRHSTGKKVLMLFILTNLVYALMLLVTIPKVLEYSNGLKLLDMMPMGYNTAYIHSLFETLGEEGRHLYLYTQIPPDLIYPFLFGISYCLLMGYFLKQLNKLDSMYFYLCTLPLIAGLADYLENFGIIILLNSYPDLSQVSMGITNLFSIVKSASTTIFFIALIIILSIRGMVILKGRMATSKENDG